MSVRRPWPHEAARCEAELLLVVNGALRVLDGDRKDPASLDVFGEHVEGVGLARIDRDAGVAVVVDESFREIDVQRNAALCVERVRLIQCDRGAGDGIPCRDRRIGGLVVADPARQAFAVIDDIAPAVAVGEREIIFLDRAVLRRDRILKAAVAQHFGIQAAVAGAVDILEEQAVQIRRDRETRLFGIDMQRCHRDPPYFGEAHSFLFLSPV